MKTLLEYLNEPTFEIGSRVEKNFSTTIENISRGKMTLSSSRRDPLTFEYMDKFLDSDFTELYGRGKKTFFIPANNLISKNTKTIKGDSEIRIPFKKELKVKNINFDCVNLIFKDGKKVDFENSNISCMKLELPTSSFKNTSIKANRIRFRPENTTPIKKWTKNFLETIRNEGISFDPNFMVEIFKELGADVEDLQKVEFLGEINIYDIYFTKNPDYLGSNNDKYFKIPGTEQKGTAWYISLWAGIDYMLEKIDKF